MRSTSLPAPRTRSALLSVRAPLTLTRALVLCGVAASAVYVSNDLVNAALHPGYSMRDQAISELSAVGSPTKRLWDLLGALYGMLIIAFAIGVLRLPSRGRALRATGWLLFAFAMTGALWAVFPMHERGAAMGWQDVGHIALSVVSVLLILSYIGIGGFALGNGFLLYSMATLLAFLVSASLTFALAPALARNEPTPWLGLIERVMIYSYLLWTAVFAAGLLARSRLQDARPRDT
jgi:hypothetical protein